ncbi:MAG TPA: PaaI family thioesterase, partial [Candidatus Solibacter sp.]|nr:PaaI family thioesterase [Candidatus Solibacter sp.]
MSPGPEKHVNMLAEISRRIASGDAPAPPIAKLIGFHPISAGGGEAVFEMEADERHWNPMGTLHGGVLCDIGDAAMGFAYATTLAEGESFTTIELKINYLRPVRKARLRASAHVV